MGSLFGGGSQTTKSSSETSPWAPQQPYLMQGLQQASNIEQQRMASGPYTGTYYAGQNGTQASAISNAAGWANGTGNAIPGQIASTSSTLQGAADPFLANATNLATNGAGAASPLAGVVSGYANGTTPALQTDPALSGALSAAAVQGAHSLGSFTNGQSQVLNQSLSDPTQQLSTDAQSYMHSAPVQDAINSTNAQINQQLNESVVPQLNRSAAMGGALNSSRAGMAEAMANENAAIATGNADSSILNNAYNTGLSTAAAERNAGLTTGMYAANSGLVDNTGLAQGQQAAQTAQSEFGTNTALNAANTGLNYNLGLTGLNANTMLGANGQLGNAAGLGINAGTAANQNAALNFALGSGAGGLQQQGDQTNANNAFAQWQGNNTYDQNVLNNYWGIVGNPLGSQSQGTSTTTQSTSPLGQIAGLGLTAAAMFGTGGAFPGVGAALGGGLGGLFGSMAGGGQVADPFQATPY